jgi:hypothetical protein
MLYVSVEQINKTEKIMNTYIETVTPRRAKEILDGNTRNRPVSQRRVDYYAQLMRDGKWHLTHQGVALSDGGVVIDGQHRLHAVIKANMPIDFNVTHGVDEDSFKYVDVGYNRTTANIFAIEGIANYTRHASGVSKYFSFKSRVMDVMTNNRNKLNSAETHDDYLKFYYENEELLKKIHSQSVKYYDTYRILKLSTIYSYFVFLIIDNGHGFDRVRGFFDNVYMFSHDSKSNAPKELFTKLINSATGTLELKPRVKSALINKAWNCYISGKTVKRLYWDEDRNSFPNLK